MARTAYFVIFSVLVGFSACTPTSKPAVPPTHAIIVVPGFKGSLLENEAGDTLWVDAREAIFGDSTLAIESPGIAGTPKAIPTAILRSLNFLGLVLENFYGTFLDDLREQCGGSKVVEFPYDWRNSAADSAYLLGERIKQLRTEGISRVSIVSHSFGGLVTSWYLRFGGQSISTAIDTWNFDPSVEQVVLAGVPYRGAYQILHDLKFGSTQGLNTKILDQVALGSFPASYELLPFGTAGSAAPIYSLDFWSKERLGLLSQPDNLEEKSEYTKLALSESAMFKEKLLAASPGNHGMSSLQLLVLTGNQESTPSVETASSGIFEADNSEIGDDTVPAETSLAPRAFSERFVTRIIRNSLPHYRLLDDARIIEFVCPPTQGAE